MHVLDKKLMRDLQGMWAQALAIALVIGAGVAMFVMTEGMLRTLQETRAAYYERYDFADVFAPLKRAPGPLSARLGDIPGVRVAVDRIKERATLDMPTLDEPVQAHVVSYPLDRDPRLNRIHLVQGRWPAADRADEMLMLETFTDAHDLSPGDTVTALINGRQRALTISGIVLSPEYIYALPPGGMMPDNKRYAVMWMNRPAMEAAYDMKGAFNNVILGLQPGVPFEAVKGEIDRLLAPYGGVGAIERKRQISHWFLTGEMNQLRNMSALVPPIFLAIAIFLLNMVITRWIETEREEIGLLKAFGYATWDISMHYVKLVMIITLVGIVGGFGAGIWLGRGLAEIYQEFFRFPFLYFHFTPAVFAISGGLSLIGALIGTAWAVRRAALLPPAEAMVPPPPTSYRRSRLEGLLKRLEGPSRMVVRHILRWPMRSAMTVLGAASGVGILVGAMFFIDAMDAMTDIQFFQSDRQDASIIFTKPLQGEALRDVQALPGVLAAEPFRYVNVRLRFQGRERREALRGVVSGGDLSRILDQDLRPVPVPDEGLVLSVKLAELLGANLGDVVIAEVTEGRRPVLELPVVQIAHTQLASPAFMNIDHLGRLMHEEGRIGGVHVILDSDRAAEFYARVKDIPPAAAITVKATVLKAFHDTMQENMMIMTTFNVGFAALIAIGVVYNAARISLSERVRELASLRVLGFTQGEVSYILLGELAVLTLLALPLGCVMGYGLAWVWALLLDTDLYRIPLVVTRDTYGQSVLVVIGASLVSGVAVYRQILKLDIVSALKTPE